MSRVCAVAARRSFALAFSGGRPCSDRVTLIRQAIAPRIRLPLVSVGSRYALPHPARLTAEARARVLLPCALSGKTGTSARPIGNETCFMACFCCAPQPPEVTRRLTAHAPVASGTQGTLNELDVL